MLGKRPVYSTCVSRVAEGLEDIACRLGHSLLFLGYGSSRAILNQFGAETCTDGAVVAIKCTAQYLTLRTLLQKLILVQRASCSTTLR